MKFLLVLLIFAFSVLCGSAQVNTEKLRHSVLASGWTNTFTATLGYAKGNNNFAKINLEHRTDFKQEKFYSFLSGNFDYEQGDKELISHDGFLHLRGILEVYEIVNPEVFFQIQFDRFITLVDRRLAGTGIRIAALNAAPGDSLTPTNLDFGIGFMYEYEHYNNAAKTKTNLVRSTNYISFSQKLNELLSYQTVLYYQQHITLLKDFRLYNEHRMSVSIWKSLKLIFTCNLKYDNSPEPEIKPFDIELSNGLSVQF